MATFSTQEALTQMKKAQNERKSELLAMAEITALRAKIASLERINTELGEQVAHARKTILGFQSGMELAEIREFAKAKASSLNINTTPISKFKDGLTVLNWLDTAIWRKTEQKEMEDGLAD